MDFFEQFDDSQSLFVDNYEPEIENLYLANEENALQFISRIIPIKNQYNRHSNPREHQVSDLGRSSDLLYLRTSFPFM